MSRQTPPRHGRRPLPQRMDYATDLTGFDRRLLDQLLAVAAEHRHARPRPATAPRRRRGTRRYRLAAVAALVIATVAGVQLTTVGPSQLRPGTGAPANAAETLSALAQTAAAQPGPGPGRYYYSKTLEGTTRVGTVDGVRFQSDQTQSNEVWVSAAHDGRRAIRVKAQGPRYRFPTPADERGFDHYWQAIRTLRNATPDPRTVHRVDRSYTVNDRSGDTDGKHSNQLPDGSTDETQPPPLTIDVEAPDRVFGMTVTVHDLPTQPQPLNATITAVAERYAEKATRDNSAARHSTREPSRLVQPPSRHALVNAYRWQLTLDLLTKPAASPQLRAAAFQVASNLPGVSLTAPNTTDRLGRTGVKLATTTIEPGGSIPTRVEILFDRTSARLLSYDLLIPNDDPSCARGCGGPANLTNKPTREFTIFVQTGTVTSPNDTP